MTGLRAHTRAREATSTRTPGGRVAKLFIPSPYACLPVYTHPSNTPEIVYTEVGA
jgi:hypothetical protein